MGKKYLILLLLPMVCIKLWSQDLTCKDFKKGKFFIPNNDELMKISIASNDSIKHFEYKRDSIITKYSIVRKKNRQIEWENGINKGEPTYELIEWIDDCTYRLKYDSSKMKLDDYQEWVNDNNGLVVSKIKIKDRCLFYNSIFTLKDNTEMSQKGVICKE